MQDDAMVRRRTEGANGAYASFLTRLSEPLLSRFWRTFQEFIDTTSASITIVRPLRLVPGWAERGTGNASRLD
jgi:hypothetical protein